MPPKTAFLAFVVFSTFQIQALTNPTPTGKNQQLTFSGINFCPNQPLDRDLLLATLEKCTDQKWSILAIDRNNTHKSDALLPEFDYLAFMPGRKFSSVPDAWQATHLVENAFEQDAFEYIEPSFSTLEGVDDQKNEGALEVLGLSCKVDEHENKETEGFFEWHLEQLHVRDAWKYCQECGTPTMGQNIKIAQPDSGFVIHQEFGKGEKIVPMVDYVEGDMNPAIDPEKQDPLEVGGVHGLSTGSIVISKPEDDQSQPHITGVAPEAELYAYRVTAPGDFLPAPILVNSDMNKLASSILDAIDRGCQVLTISLGGLRHTAVHKAIKKAVERGMIVLSAAGNKVMHVVFPASDYNVIAIGATNFHRREWVHSSKGRKVDICAPGQAVYRACYTKEEKEKSIHRASGTSFATASCAGIAALWLAHHGYQKLCDKYGPHNLNEVFRHCIKASSSQDWASQKLAATGEFGAGIADALNLLKLELPSYQKLSDQKVVRSHGQWLEWQREMERHTDAVVLGSFSQTYVTGDDAVNISTGFVQAMGNFISSVASQATSLIKEIAFNFQLDSFIPFSIFQSGESYKAQACRSKQNTGLDKEIINDNLIQVSKSLLNCPISQSLRDCLKKKLAASQG